MAKYLIIVPIMMMISGAYVALYELNYSQLFSALHESIHQAPAELDNWTMAEKECLKKLGRMKDKIVDFESLFFNINISEECRKSINGVNI